MALFYNKYLINKLYKSSNILISPLDWGLGHATRCIPIINHLLKQGNTVFIATEGNIKALLEKEFPQVTFLSLKGYNVKYAKQKKWLVLKILIQIPRVVYLIYKEHQWLKKAIKIHSINGVISDNRFGLYTTQVPCAYITHQLLIKAGNNFVETIISKIHQYFINKYTECWIPDFKGDKNIAGNLSHPLNSNKNIKYIGCLSRFHLIPNVEIKYDVLILLSGPEPQRTILEKILLVQLNEFKGRVLFVRGLPGVHLTIAREKKIILNTANEIEIKNHLNAVELNFAIQQAEIVISRSGYTTVMDLIKLNKKAILIPTPGQTEQEYLAKHLMNNKIFYTENQHEFVLNKSIKKAAEFDFLIVNQEMNQYLKTVDKFIEKIKD